jgi:predicted aspartyl protease
MKRLVVFLACAAFSTAAGAQPLRHHTGSLAVPLPDPRSETAETLAYLPDAASRMTLAVNVGGQGPFRFVVDTGAERTVVSSELALALGLDSGGDVTLASVSSVSRVPSVLLPGLEVGRRTLPMIRAPSLAQRNIGAQGMLGVDSLQSQRVVFDFRNREITLSTSLLEEQNWPADTIVVTGRTLLGRLILTDARIDGQRIRVIVDTGSQVTIANNALRRRLLERGRLGETRMLELRGVTGDIALAEYTRAGRIQIGDVHLDDMPIAFADVELFNLLGLTDRPAILLGMDALRMFERVSIDFARRRVRLLPPRSSLVPETRMASAGNGGRGSRFGS